MLCLLPGWPEEKCKQRPSEKPDGWTWKSPSQSGRGIWSFWKMPKWGSWKIKKFMWRSLALCHIPCMYSNLNIEVFAQKYFNCFKWILVLYVFLFQRMGGSAFHKILKCVVTCGGTYKPKKGKLIQLNVKLASGLTDSIDGEFKKTFP